MLKSRMLGRSRTPRRDAWHPPAALNTPTAQLAAAQRVAQAFVQTHWPELRHVPPRITTSLPQCPSPALLERLGVPAHELPAPSAPTTYTFTFARDAVGADLAEPLVATVTVDRQQRVVKVLLSK
jgi:hypothetical protein